MENELRYVIFLITICFSYDPIHIPYFQEITLGPTLRPVADLAR
jgi:hypothetical protein